MADEVIRRAAEAEDAQALEAAIRLGAEVDLPVPLLPSGGGAGPVTVAGILVGHLTDPYNGTKDSLFTGCGLLQGLQTCGSRDWIIRVVNGQMKGSLR